MQRHESSTVCSCLGCSRICLSSMSRTAWLSPNYFTSLHFTFQCSHFWKTVLAWIEMCSVLSDLPERELMKPRMLRKLVQNSDSGRPCREKKIPLDLAHSAEPFVCPCYSVHIVLVSCLGCAGWLPWVTQVVGLSTDPGSNKSSVALELMNCAASSVNFFQAISDIVEANGYVDFYSPWINGEWIKVVGFLFGFCFQIR